MPRPPLQPLRVGDRTIPLALPPLPTRITFVQTWAGFIPEGADEAPLAVSQCLAFAALGLAWAEAHRKATTPMEAPPTTLALVRYDFLALGEAIGEALDGDAVDGRALVEQADLVATAFLTSVTVPRPAAVEAAAVFSEAESARASSSASSPPTAGSDPRSPGAT